MKRILARISENPFWLILLTVIFKLPMFFTNHIQEDSFITWRVAKNLVNYGVIGFNGHEKISASTTHFYVFITALFNIIFGENFIYPLLIFSSILFAIGSWWLSKILFRKRPILRVPFVIFLNMTPPALTASLLGMEYGILFFLYNGLLYFGLFRGKKWAYLVFPILLLWTRIDTVIFLGLFFLVDIYVKKKLNFYLILGGILGVFSVVGFNYFYFGEIVNHTIAAKKIAYKNLLQNNSFEFVILQWAYYGGLIKKYSYLTLLIFVAFLGFLGFVLVKIHRDGNVRHFVKVVLFFITAFALIKITIFSGFKAYFDWYYWLPRVFLFAVILYFFLNLDTKREMLKFALLTAFFSGLYFFQFIQSYTIGYMEERQRMQIAADINREKTAAEQSIFLEPAGIIPFYTGLYTYDEVGLVNAKINDEMLKDEKYWWINSVKRFQPDYILTIAGKPEVGARFYTLKPEDFSAFNKNYHLEKVYSIKKIHEEAPALLRWIYKIRPIGKDYFLYRKNQNQ